MLRVQQKISQGLEVLQYFTIRQWIFDSRNFLSLDQCLSAEEYEIYDMDIKKNDTDDYLRSCVEGGRLYVLHEDPTRVSINRIHHNMYVLKYNR